MLQFSVGVGVQFQPKEGSKGSWQATNGWSHHCTRWWWRRWWWRRSWWWWTGDQQLKLSHRTIAGYLFWLDWLIAQLLVLITVNRHSEDCGCFWMPSSWTAARWGIFHLFEGRCTFGFQCRTAAGKIIKIPPFVWKSVRKLESSQEYLETDGLYRVPGDAAKVQKIRVEVDQVRMSEASRSLIVATEQMGDIR